MTVVSTNDARKKTNDKKGTEECNRWKGVDRCDGNEKDLEARNF